MAIKSFLDLEIYQESFELNLEIERLFRTFPEEEKYRLTDQGIRASRAIPALIAEGWAKKETPKEFRKYLKDALGELNETMNHIRLADRLGYIKKEGYARELLGRYEKLGGKINNLKNNWKNF